LTGNNHAKSTKKIQQHKILYIEDNLANLRLIQQAFTKRQDINLFCATNANEGIKIAISEKPALILMDIQMPEMNGTAAFKELQDNSETKAIPVIAISANAMESEINNILALGFKDYITKPVDIKVLFNTIDRII
jgi:CheY-like chemotaxis protein